MAKKQSLTLAQQTKNSEVEINTLTLPEDKRQTKLRLGDNFKPITDKP